MSESRVVKVVVIGDGTVGKTALLMNYVDGVKAENASTIATIGVDFKNKILKIDGKSVKLQIWDTAGQERFRTIAVSYYRKAQGIALIYDVSNRESFEHLQSWMDSINDNAEENVPIILIGNKCDLVHKVSEEEGTQFADEYKLPIFFTSAKTGKNVQESFLELTKIIINKKEPQKIEPKIIDPKEKNEDEKKKGGCCN